MERDERREKEGIVLVLVLVEEEVEEEEEVVEVNGLSEWEGRDGSDRGDWGDEMLEKRVEGEEEMEGEREGEGEEKEEEEDEDEKDEGEGERDGDGEGDGEEREEGEKKERLDEGDERRERGVGDGEGGRDWGVGIWEEIVWGGEEREGEDGWLVSGEGEVCECEEGMGRDEEGRFGCWVDLANGGEDGSS